MDFHTKTVREVTSWLRTLPSFCITEEVITSFQGRFIMYEWEYFTISILEADMDGAAIATAISVGPTFIVISRQEIKGISSYKRGNITLI